MSERSLGRRFKEVTNITMSRYIEDVRLSLARRLLETSEQSIQAVADTAGFGTAATLRRVFERRLHVSPSLYRASFGTENISVDDGIADGAAMRMDLENVVNGKSVW